MRIILMPGCAFQTQQRAKLALVLTLSHTLDRHCTDGVHGGTNRTLIISSSFSCKSSQSQVRSNSISKVPHSKIPSHLLVSQPVSCIPLHNGLSVTQSVARVSAYSEPQACGLHCVDGVRGDTIRTLN